MLCRRGFILILYLTVIGGISWPVLFAQKIDSLSKLLQFAKEDTIKLEILDELANENLNVSLETATFYANEGLALANKLKFSEWQGYAYDMVAKVNMYKGNYNIAIENYLQTLKIQEKLGVKRGILTCYSNIATVLMINKEFNNALDYYKKADSILSQLNDEKLTAELYNNIGIAYKEVKKYTEAYKFYFKALELRIYQKNRQAIAEVYENIGVLLFTMDSIKEADNYFNKALLLESEINDGYGFASTSINYGALLNHKNDFKKAIAVLDTGLNYVLDQGDMHLALIAYNNLADAYKGLKNSEKEAFYLRKYVELREEIFSEEKARQISELQQKFEDEKKVKEITELRTRDAELRALTDKRKLYIIIALISVGLLLAIIMLLVIKNRSAKKQQEFEMAQNRAELEQKAIRAQMNPHFIFNSINSIQNYILSNDGQYAYDYLARFSKLIRQVLSNSQHETLSIKKELELLGIYIDLEQRRFKDRFDFEINCAENVDANEIKIPVMLIQPFIENAIWHGIMNLKGVRKGKIKLDISLVENILRINIKDNGVGREFAAKLKSNDEHESVGVMFTQRRLELLKAVNKNVKIEITNLFDEKGKASGTQVEIFLPLKYS